MAISAQSNIKIPGLKVEAVGRASCLPSGSRMGIGVAGIAGDPGVASLKILSMAKGAGSDSSSDCGGCCD